MHMISRFGSLRARLGSMPCTAAAATLKTAASPSTPAAAACRSVQMAASQVRRGQVIELRNRLWLVTEWSHHKQGRGGAHFKVDLREILDGSKAFERYNAGDTVTVADLQSKTFHFLYADGNNVHLIDHTSFEEIVIPSNLISLGEKVIPFLKDTTEVKVDFHNDKPVIARVPDRAVFSIIETAPPAHTSESTRGTLLKPAVLDNGQPISVPEFVNVGDFIVVDLGEQKYVSRAKDVMA